MNVLRLFPEEEKSFWERVLNEKNGILSEIRLRAGREAFLYQNGLEYYIDREGRRTREKKLARVFTKQELNKLLLRLCKYSMYAFEDELRAGYLTLEGGHRVGVAGSVVMEQGKIKTIQNISFLNFRMAHQFLGMADPVLPWVYEDGGVKNTIIISPPGCGKTTLLRDLIRQISNGNAYGMGRIVGVVDERSEIGGNYQGVPQNDLGVRTDVMDGCPKMLGMRLIIRSMAPEVLAVDELGDEEEWKEIWKAQKCGVKIIATVHGEGVEKLMEKNAESFFEEAILLCRENGVPKIKGHVRLGRRDCQ